MATAGIEKDRKWECLRASTTSHLTPELSGSTRGLSEAPELPLVAFHPLLSVYGNYEKYYRLWEKNTEARARGITPPVFIVVCNCTNVSKLVFDFIAG